MNKIILELIMKQIRKEITFWNIDVRQIRELTMLEENCVSLVRKVKKEYIGNLVTKK